MRSLKVAAALVLAATLRLDAQTTNNQLWAEYMANYPFASSWNVELSTAYSTLLESPRWRSLDIQATPEYSLSARVDVMGGILVSRTIQYEALSSSEFRWMLGTRIHLTPFSRVQTRLLLRFEHRDLYYRETDTWQESNRMRLRLETLTPINSKSMFQGERIWYLLVDAEAFIVADQQVSERFANRYRLRVGPGYRLNYTWRFEFVYTLQESRNTLGGDFETTDNLFRFRVKHYMHKSKPSTVSGNGN